jgi:hypothetical protein
MGVTAEIQAKFSISRENDRNALESNQSRETGQEGKLRMKSSHPIPQKGAPQP